MDIDTYHYLVAVYQYRNLSTAAKKLYISQPSLTKHINKVEESLGVTLFIRNKIPIGVTKAGEEYIRYAKKILELQQELVAAVNRAALNEITDISIGCNLNGARYLQDILSQFRLEHPNIRLNVLEYAGLSCEKGLRNNECDIIVNNSSEEAEDIDYEIIREEPLVLISSPNSPVFEQALRRSPSGLEVHDVLPGNLENETYIMTSPGKNMTYWQTKLLEDLGISPKKYLYYDNIDVVAMMAYVGLGTALVPLQTARHVVKGNYHHFGMIPGHYYARKLVIAKKKEKTLSAEAQILWDFVKAK